MSHLAEKIETLTPQQTAAVEEFVELLLMRGQEHVLAQAAAAASEPSFAAFWNNSEDDAYDAI
jgi:hypothetical protein